MNNQKGFANIILVVVIVILVGAVGYFAFVKKSEPVAQQPTPTPTQTQKPISPTPTPTPNPTANWKTYTNTTIGYNLKYPEAYTLTVSDPNFVSMNEGSNSKVDIRYRAGDSSTTNISWFDSEPVGDITLGGITGKKFVFKYCDGPGCGPDTVAYVVRYNGKLLGLEFLGDRIMDATESQILSTFKFTK